jgi:hypothetical protein
MINTKATIQVSESKRKFLKFSVILPTAFVLKEPMLNYAPSIFLDDDIVIINGWVMLKSDFLQG